MLFLKTRKLKKENQKLKEQIENLRKQKEELVAEGERLKIRKSELEQLIQIQGEHKKLVDNLIEYLKLFGREENNFQIPYVHNRKETPEGGEWDEYIIPSIKVCRYGNRAC